MPSTYRKTPAVCGRHPLLRKRVNRLSGTSPFPLRARRGLQRKRRKVSFVSPVLSIAPFTHEGGRGMSKLTESSNYNQEHLLNLLTLFRKRGWPRRAGCFSLSWRQQTFNQWFALLRAKCHINTEYLLSESKQYVLIVVNLLFNVQICFSFIVIHLLILNDVQY